MIALPVLCSEPSSDPQLRTDAWHTRLESRLSLPSSRPCRTDRYFRMKPAAVRNVGEEDSLVEHLTTPLGMIIATGMKRFG